MVAFPVELLQCPRCLGTVIAGSGPGVVTCTGCGRRAEVTAGFLDMLREPGRPDPAAPTPAQKLMESKAFVRLYESVSRPFFTRLFAGPRAGVPAPAQEFEIYRKVLSLDGSTGTFLDLSCGAGYFTLLIAATAPRATVVGLDISAAMLERAAVTDTSDAVHWARGDVRGLPFRDGVFDGVSNPGSLHLYADPDGAFREVFRLLKPGGVYTLSTFADSPRRSAEYTARLLGVRRTDLVALPDDLGRAGFVDYTQRTFGDAFVATARKPG